MQLLVSGSLAYDRIMDFPDNFSNHILPDKIHILNVCFMVTGLTERFGGTAGNIAYTLALLGEKPLILATYGHDCARYEARLKELGLPLTGIKKIDQVPTASAYITTDKADNQITAFNPGAMSFPSEFDFKDIDPSDSLAIISPGSLEDMMVYSRKYKEMGLPYIFDPGQSIPAFSGDELAEMITGSKILIVNDYELEMIVKATGLSKTDLLGRAETLITTLGEKGAEVSGSQAAGRIPAAPVSRAVDPTGAGDAFRAGLLKGLAMGCDIVEAARMGATAAAFAVEHLGTQEHHFTEEDFWSRHPEH